MEKIKMITELPTEVQSLLRSTVNIYSYSQCATELLQNSLDSYASSIALRVDLCNHKIQIVDNGDGILKNDLESVGKRYMTSKCKSVIDLNENLNKYGFRGEALASIIAMSENVSIVCRHKETQDTYKKDFLKGTNGDVQKIKVRPTHGTTITITNFMYNLCVRQKRVDLVLDMEEIRLAMESIALMHYQVSLSLRDDSNGKLVFKSHKSKSLKEAFLCLLDNRVGNTLRQITIAKEKYSIDVHIAKEGNISKSLQFVYINKRLVKNSALQKVFNNLLLKKTYTMKEENNKRIDSFKSSKNNPWNMQQNIECKKFPVFVVNLSCPYSAYDITFLPDKSLVEFKNWDKILKMINVLIAEIVELELGMPRHDTEDKQRVAEDEKESFGQPIDKLYLKNIVDKAFKNSHEKFGPSQLQNAIKGKPAKRKRKKSFEKGSMNANEQLQSSFKQNNQAISQIKNCNKYSHMALDVSHCSKGDLKQIRRDKSNCFQYSTQNQICPNNKRFTNNQEGSCDKNELQIFNKDGGKALFVPLEKNIDTVCKSITLKESAKYNCNSAVKRFNDLSNQLSKLEKQIKTHLPERKTNNNLSVCDINVYKNNVKGNFSAKNLSKCVLKRNTFKKPFLKIKKYTSNKVKKYRIDKCIKNSRSNMCNEIVHSMNVEEYTVEISEHFRMTKKRSKNNFNRTLDFVNTIIDKNPCKKLQNAVFQAKETTFNSEKKFLSNDDFLFSFDSHKNYSKKARPVSQENVPIKNKSDKKDCSVQTDIQLTDFSSSKWNQSIFDANVACQGCHNDEKMNHIERFCNTGSNTVKSFSCGRSFDAFLKKYDKEIVLGRKSHKIVIDSESDIAEDQQNNTFCRMCRKELLKDDCDISQQILDQEWNYTNSFQLAHNCNSNIDITFHSNDSVTKNDRANNENFQFIEKSPDLKRSGLSLNEFCDKQSGHFNKEIEETNDAQNSYTNDSNIIDCSMPLTAVEKMHWTKNDQRVVIENCNKITQLHGYLNSHDSFSDMFENDKEGNAITDRSMETSVVDETKGQIKDSHNKNNYRSIKMVSVIKSNFKQIENDFGSSLKSSFKYSMNAAKEQSDMLRHSPGSKVLDNKIQQSNHLENEFGTEINSHRAQINLSSVGGDHIYSNADGKYDIRDKLILKDNTSEFEDTATSNRWAIMTDSFGKIIYLNEKTGMTLYDNPMINEAPSYRIFKRPWFVPKGMSPILNLPDGSNVNENKAKKNFLSKNNDKTDELCKIKWIKPYFDENMYADFFDEVDKHSTICELVVFDSSMFLGKKSATTSKTIVFNKDVLKTLKVISQVDNKFIAAVVSEENATSKYLVLFDQHAVDERVRLEILLKEYKDQNHKWKHVSSTNEIKIRLSSSEVTSLSEYRNIFENMGLIFDNNDCEVNINAFPACFASKELILDGNALKSLIFKLIIEEIEVLKTTRGTASLIPNVIYHTISTEACRGAIKFGMSLTRLKCEKMIESLANCDVPFQCAHGRPAMIVLANLNQFHDRKIPKVNFKTLTCKVSRKQ